MGSPYPAPLHGSGARIIHQIDLGLHALAGET